MRRLLAAGLILGLSCQISLPVLAAGPLSGGVGSGFTSGLGWGLCSAVGKGILKVGRHITGRDKKDTDANAQGNDKLGPEDYYNRGLDEGYARAKEEGYGLGSEDTYARGQQDRYADHSEGGYGPGIKTSVKARRLVATRSGNQQQVRNHRGSRRAAQANHTGYGTISARPMAQPQKNNVAHLNSSLKKKQTIASQPESP